MAPNEGRPLSLVRLLLINRFFFYSGEWKFRPPRDRHLSAKKTDGFFQWSPFYFLLKILLSKNEIFLTLFSHPLLLRTLWISQSREDLWSPGRWAKSLLHSPWSLLLPGEGLTPAFYNWDGCWQGHLIFAFSFLFGNGEVPLFSKGNTIQAGSNSPNTEPERKPMERVMHWFSVLVKNDLLEVKQPKPGSSMFFLCCF